MLLACAASLQAILFGHKGYLQLQLYLLGDYQHFALAGTADIVMLMTFCRSLSSTCLAIVSRLPLQALQTLQCI